MSYDKDVYDVYLDFIITFVFIEILNINNY